MHAVSLAKRDASDYPGVPTMEDPGLLLEFQRLPVALTRRFFLHHIVYFANDAVYVDEDFTANKATGQDDIGLKRAALVDRPDFLAVVGGSQFWCEAAKIGSQVVDVTLQHGFGAVVACRVDGLRQIDDDRPVAAD